MIDTRTLAEKLKAAPSVADGSGKYILMIDKDAEIIKVSTDGTIIGLNAASASKLNNVRLENEDLNDIKPVGLNYYFGYGNNTCYNKPNGINGFHLLAEGREGGYAVQTLSAEGVDKVYRRVCIANAWSKWKRMLTDEDITSLTSRIEALEAKIK